jgi:ABC-type branched-subunit amino acid transport system substrate-binding protein
MRVSTAKPLAILAALALLTAACGGGGGQPAPQAEAPTGEGSAAPAQTRQADGRLSFGTLLPETGSLAFLGPPEFAGVDLALQDIQQAGGVPGMQVVLEQANRRDSGDTSTDIATQSTDAMLANNVDAIIGAASSGVTLTVIDKIVGAGVIQFSPANTSAAFTTYPDRGLYFRTAPPDDLQGRVLGDLVAGDGNASAVVMSRDDSYGNGLREATARAFEASGGTVAESFAYDPEAQNFDAEVQQVVQANPDAVVIVGFDETSRILQGLIAQGFGPAQKKLYGADGNMAATLPTQVDPANPGVLAGMTGTSPLPSQNQAFLDRLRAFRPELTDVTYAAESYDAIVITTLAAAIAGTDAPADVAREINGVTKGGEKCMDFARCMELVRAGTDIDYDGASGPGEFVEAGEPGAGDYGVQQFQPDGSLPVLRNVHAAF